MEEYVTTLYKIMDYIYIEMGWKLPQERIAEFFIAGYLCEGRKDEIFKKFQETRLTDRDSAHDFLGEHPLTIEDNHKIMYQCKNINNSRKLYIRFTDEDNNHLLTLTSTLKLGNKNKMLLLDMKVSDEI